MPGSSLLPLGVQRLVALDEDTSWSSSLLEKQQTKAGCEKGEARALPGGRNNAKNGNCRVYAPQLTCLSWRQLRVVRESVLEKGVRWRSPLSLRPRSEVGVRASPLLACAWLVLGEVTCRNPVLQARWTCLAKVYVAQNLFCLKRNTSEI